MWFDWMEIVIADEETEVGFEGTEQDLVVGEHIISKLDRPMSPTTVLVPRSLGGSYRPLLANPNLFCLLTQLGITYHLNRVGYEDPIIFIQDLKRSLHFHSTSSNSKHLAGSEELFHHLECRGDSGPITAAAIGNLLLGR